MGIYYDHIVQGVKWEMYDDNKNIIKKFEKIYENKVTLENIKELMEEYEKITDSEKHNIKYYVLKSYSSTHELNTKPRQGWLCYNKLRLEKFFMNGYDTDIC
jgi:hypothetical protein